MTYAGLGFADSGRERLLVVGRAARSPDRALSRSTSSPLRNSGSVTSTVGVWYPAWRPESTIDGDLPGLIFCVLANADLDAGDRRRHARPPEGARHDDGAGGHHLSRSRRDRRDPSLHRPRSGPDAHADGLRVQRLLSVVRAVRDSHRLVGRQGRHPQGPDAHRLLVVGVHGADRLCVELLVAAG